MIVVMKSFTETLRDEIKAELIRRRIGQKPLAEAWGITQSATSYKLSGGTAMTTEHVDAAAKVLGYKDGFHFIAVKFPQAA